MSDKPLTNQQQSDNLMLTPAPSIQPPTIPNAALCVSVGNPPAWNSEYALIHHARNCTPFGYGAAQQRAYNPQIQQFAK